MAEEDWDAALGRSIGIFLNGQGIAGRDPRGERIIDRSFLVYFNAGDESVDCTLPPVEHSPRWEIVVDTAGAIANSELRESGSSIPVQAKSLVVLRAHREDEEIDMDNTVASSLTVLTGSTVDNPSSSIPDV